MSIYEGDSIEREKRPLRDLIEHRRQQLALKKPALVQKWGYANVSKGMRRLTELADGNFAPTEVQLMLLASALELPADDVHSSYAETVHRKLQNEEDLLQREHAAWCVRFVPHAILITERKIPNPIFVVAICGAENILRIDFDTEQPEETWLDQVSAKLPDSVIAFGSVMGFVLNYSSERASEYDRNGQFIRALPQPLRPGYATLTLKGGRETASEQWKALGAFSVSPAEQS